MNKEALAGYRVTTYKEKKLNGSVISKDVLSTDTYKAMTRIVKIGPEAPKVVAPAVSEPIVEASPASEPESKPVSEPEAEPAAAPKENVE